MCQSGVGQTWAILWLREMQDLPYSGVSCLHDSRDKIVRTHLRCRYYAFSAHAERRESSTVRHYLVSGYLIRMPNPHGLDVSR